MKSVLIFVIACAAAWAQIPIPGSGGGGGGGDVSSVFGRIGAVTATTGDYTAAQVTNAVDSTATYANPVWITSLAYSKLTGAPSLAAIATSGSASDLTTGTVATARLGTGAASSSTYLRGDGTWATPAGGAFTTACEIVIGDPGAATPILADDNDAPALCANVSGSTQTITAIACYSNVGSPTVRPIVTGGSSTSLLSSDLTCGAGSYATGTLNGTPTLAAGATIDANIASAGGVAKYIVIRITRSN